MMKKIRTNAAYLSYATQRDADTIAAVLTRYLEPLERREGAYVGYRDAGAAEWRIRFMSYRRDAVGRVIGYRE